MTKTLRLSGGFLLRAGKAPSSVMSFRASAHTGVGIPRIEGGCHTSDIGHWFAMTQKGGSIKLMCDCPRQSFHFDSLRGQLLPYETRHRWLLIVGRGLAPADYFPLSYSSVFVGSASSFIVTDRNSQRGRRGHDPALRNMLRIIRRETAKSPAKAQAMTKGRRN